MTDDSTTAGGIPTIIKPFFGDQFFWADRVEALGIGTAVRKLTVESLTQALITATTDQKQITRARYVGEKIRAVRPLICNSMEVCTYRVPLLRRTEWKPP